MVSVGQYLLVSVLVILVNMYRTSAQTCSSYAIELKASPNASSHLTIQNYPSLQVWCWKITAPAGHVVELTFLAFYMEGPITSVRNCEDLTSEYLAIYDGNDEDKKLLGRYCSRFLPPKVFSSGTTLFLEFKRNAYSEIGTGFGLEYSATIPKPDSSICSPFNTYSQNNNIQLSGSSGYITSPLYGTKYPSNMQCTWVITVSQGKKIKLTFLDFSVGQDSYYCSVEDEYLEIRDGQYEESHLINQYCSSSKPSPVHSTGRYLWIRFKSNSDNFLDEDNGRKTNGFKAKFEEDMISEKPNLLVPSTELSGMSEKRNYQVASSESSGMSDGVGAIIGFATAVAVVIIVIAVCARRMRQIQDSPAAQRSYPPPRSNPMSTSGSTAQPSAPSRFVPSSPIGYSSVPQRRYPPSCSNLMSTTGGTAQPSAPSRFVPPPPVDYSSVPQRIYPPSCSNPMSTSGGTAQPSAPSRFVPPPPVDYFSVPHRSYPPGSYPMSTTDVIAQPSAPMNDHPSSTLLNDPPPAYSEVVPDVPPPPYPGISPHPSHIPTTQHQATS